jgi:AmiR/NasT family two-component response regulator
MFVKVNDSPFVRDIKSMGLSNVDPIEKQEYYSKLKLIQTQKQELNSIRSEINTLKDDLSDIKKLLLQLTDKG